MNPDTIVVPQAATGSEKAPPASKQNKKSKSPDFSDPLTLDALVKLPASQIQPAFQKLVPGPGKKLFGLKEAVDDDVARAVEHLQARKDGLQVLRRMLAAHLRIEVGLPHLEKMLTDLATSFLQAELVDRFDALKSGASLAPDEAVARAWQEFLAGQERLKAAEAIDHVKDKKTPIREWVKQNEASESQEEASEPVPSEEVSKRPESPADRMRELLLLWIETRHLAGTLGGTQFLACVAALADSGSAPAPTEPRWAHLLEVVSGLQTPKELTLVSSAIHRTIRTMRRQVETEQQRGDALERGKAELEDANRQFQRQVQSLQEALASAQEENDRLRGDVASAGNLSLSALHEIRARMRGFLEGETTRYLHTALDAARSEPPRARVIVERLETVLEQVQSQIDWLTTKDRA